MHSASKWVGEDYCSPVFSNYKLVHFSFSLDSTLLNYCGAVDNVWNVDQEHWSQIPIHPNDLRQEEVATGSLDWLSYPHLPAKPFFIVSLLAEPNGMFSLTKMFQMLNSSSC